MEDVGRTKERGGRKNGGCREEEGEMSEEEWRMWERGGRKE